MANVITDVTEYFRGLAEEHVLLRHRTEERHFFRGELEEFFKQLRSDVRFPCLILEGSQVAYSGQSPRLLKRRTGAFIVADKYDQLNDYDDIQYRMGRCEGIGDDIVARMLRDAGEAPECPFMALQAEDFAGTFLDNQGSRYVGYRVEFEASEEGCATEESVWQSVSEGSEEAG